VTISRRCCAFIKAPPAVVVVFGSFFIFYRDYEITTAAAAAAAAAAAEAAAEAAAAAAAAHTHTHVRL